MTTFIKSDTIKVLYDYCVKYSTTLRDKIIIGSYVFKCFRSKQYKIKL